MKWKNKGHEFDDLYKKIEKIKKCYLFGAGYYGERVCRLLEKEFDVLGFIDNSKEKQHTEVCGKRVYALEEVEDALDESTGIIVTITPAARLQVIQQMTRSEKINEEQIFTMELFMSVYEAYKNGRVYIPSVSFLPSTRCNLRCEACLNFTPYIKHFEERSWEQIKETVDVFFSCVDYIFQFYISGGEPMLYPHMKKLVEYVDDNYRDKIYIIRTVTNGTVLPKQELLETLASRGVELTVDDYREAVPESADTFDRLIELLEKYQVKYEINKTDEWIDLAPLTTNHEGWSEEQIRNHFESCQVPWQELRDGKLYSCNYASYAIIAGLAEEDETEYFDLRKFTPDQAKELVEFRMGYNTKGYVEFCKRCSGFFDVNPNKVKPAKQVAK
ncbi:radical SAM protein [Lachnospiraceae bacterium 46-15]